jgi:2-C-methyl-D-erythritol 2,4-cyclodiphosphate synthase
MKYQPPRVGHGFDLHRLEPGRPLIVAGVDLHHDRGAVAHSDGDVVYHALTDAILGALGEDDLGQLFPDDDPRWKDQESSRFVLEAVQRMDGADYQIGNIDLTVILQRPKLGPAKNAMRAKLADLLHCEVSRINLKGKTHEEVDALGRNEAIACHAVVLLVQDPPELP